MQIQLRRDIIMYLLISMPLKRSVFDFMLHFVLSFYLKFIERILYNIKCFNKYL